MQSESSRGQCRRCVQPSCPPVAAWQASPPHTERVQLHWLPAKAADFTDGTVRAARIDRCLVNEPDTDEPSAVALWPARLSQTEQPPRRVRVPAQPRRHRHVTALRVQHGGDALTEARVEAQETSAASSPHASASHPSSSVVVGQRQRRPSRRRRRSSRNGHARRSAQPHQRQRPVTDPNDAMHPASRTE